MSKKDFHPSAWRNIKKVWEARKKQGLEKKKDEEMRAQYEKEQEILNNKALLGDEKARMGLSFMYDVPAGFNKHDKVQEGKNSEPKFEWQRKQNAPSNSRTQLAGNMRNEHGLQFRSHIMEGVLGLLAEQTIENVGKSNGETAGSVDEQKLMRQFLETLSEKERSKLYSDFFQSTSGKKEKKKDEKKFRKRERKEKKPVKKVKASRIG